MAESRILINHELAGTSYSVVVEDDGRVAYAYLCNERKIVADVWLYNRDKSPDEPEWSDRSLAPFANPSAYALEFDLSPISDKRDVAVAWQNDPISATISIHGKNWAVLREGFKPGYCRLAKKAGPLARPMSELI